MHDAKGRELKPGDHVMIPCVVLMTHASPDFCNLDVESLATMPGNDSKLRIAALNTRQVLRANEGDDLSFVVRQSGASSIIE